MYNKTFTETRESKMIFINGYAPFFNSYEMLSLLAYPFHKDRKEHGDENLQKVQLQLIIYDDDGHIRDVIEQDHYVAKSIEETPPDVDLLYYTICSRSDCHDEDWFKNTIKQVKEEKDSYLIHNVKFTVNVKEAS